MKKLSVALATFNEEEFLDKCLESIRQLADEIVIADGDSTDKTCDIAKKYHARVLCYDNPPIFHINKQRAIDNCSGEWILQLDADEQVSNELKNEIRAVIKNKNSNDGYWIPRKNFFLGKFLTKGGQYPDYTMRLYKKGKGRLPCKDVHEQAEIDGTVGYLKNPLLHFADESIVRYLHRFNRYTDLLSQQLKNEKKNKFLYLFPFLVFKPIGWFLKTYVRHRGFIDGWQGFVFSLFSAIRFPVAFIKYLTHGKN